MIPTKFDSRRYLYSLAIFLVSLFVLYSFQKTDLPNPLLRIFYNFWLYFADKVTTETNNFVSFIVKIILLEFVLLAANKTQYFSI